MNPTDADSLLEALTHRFEPRANVILRASQFSPGIIRAARTTSAQDFQSHVNKMIQGLDEDIAIADGIIANGAVD